jgi:hypothetical protein
LIADDFGRAILSTGELTPFGDPEVFPPFADITLVFEFKASKTTDDDRPIFGG